jgi:ubiquinone/menaquinone biosynthesis C-methylase UbiE
MHEGLHDLPHDSTILALGCDEVFLAPQLREYSFDVTVLDRSGGQVTQLARRFPDIAFLQHNPANPLPFAHDTFDAIWCCEFLDRIFDPSAALQEMHRVLAPGGRLLVTVPDHGTVRSVLIALFKWDEHFAPTNPRIRHFTRSMLVKLARRAGFEHVRTTTGGSVRPIAGSLVPRSILLEARKGPAARLTLAANGRRADDRELVLGDELAFASRVRAG